MTIVGNRPQFIKMTAVNRELERRSLQQVVVHTGQHYDRQMNHVFFDELAIRAPDVQLAINGRTHGAMTGQLLEQIEAILLKLEPRSVLVYGDTNSTLAASLAAVKMSIPVAHVEAGPRLGNLETPEEVNRIISDHCSMVRFVSDAVSRENLRREGIESGVVSTGDVMLDVFLEYSRLLSGRGKRRSAEETQVYVTLHRPQNVDHRECHEMLLDFITRSDASFVFPLHPRTEKKIGEFGLLDNYRGLRNLRLSGAIGYVDSIRELLDADFVITDSGGLQKEAYFAGKMSMLMLPETPWPELEGSGWQLLAGWVRDGRIAAGFQDLRERARPLVAPPFFGSGDAARRIVDALVERDLVGTE